MKVNQSNFLNVNFQKQQASMKELVSGKQINSAKDDAANLQIANRLFEQLSGTQVAVRNANDAASFASVADTALSGLADTSNRINELSLQAANASLSAADRNAIQQEVSQLAKQAADIVGNTSFGGQQIFSQGNNTFNFQVSSEANNTTSLNTSSLPDVISQLSNIDVTDQTNAQNAVSTTKQIGELIGQQRGSIGAFQNRIDSSINNLMNQAEQTANSYSRIMDTDYAKSVSENIRNDFLVKSATAVSAQANISQKQAVALL
jgi:flagellin